MEDSATDAHNATLLHLGAQILFKEGAIRLLNRKAEARGDAATSRPIRLFDQIRQAAADIIGIREGPHRLQEEIERIPTLAERQERARLDDAQLFGLFLPLPVHYIELCDCRLEARGHRCPLLCWLLSSLIYSHSMVAGGLPVTS